MLISLRHKFIFIANLKSASTAIEMVLRPMADIALLESRFGKHCPLSWVQAKFEWLFNTMSIDEFFIFGVMRDPIDYVLSLFNSHRDPKFRRFPDTYTGDLTFEEFLDKWPKNNPGQFSDQYLRFVTIEGSIGANYIISYEHLAQGMDFVLSKLGVLNSIPLRVENRSQGQFTRRDLTERQLYSIRDRFRTDLGFIHKWCDRPLYRGSRHQLDDEATQPSRGRQMVNRYEVIYAYRLFFGREPESDDVIDRWLGLPNWAALRHVFINSEEFRQKLGSTGSLQTPESFLLSSPIRVDVEVTPDDFARLLAHVRKAWEALGTQQPHWSVLTDPRFLPDNLASNREEFYRSGEQSAKIFESALSRGGTKVLPRWNVFELGCGVGRVTAQLAQQCNHVVACDISRAHLELAKSYLSDMKVLNVEFLQLAALEALTALEPFDLFYSIIVLQHNPPPLIYRMLQIILGKIKLGGYAYFQVPVAATNYEFDVTQYLGRLEGADAVMEMHVLPQPYLFELLDQNAMRVLDLQRDNLPGPGFHSITLLAEKNRDRA